jgi:hypothetical protein
MWKSFANCRNTLSFYHFLFLHLLALFRCNGNSKSIWNWFFEPIQHTVCTSIVGICILWQFHRKSFVVPLFLLLKFANHYNNHTKIVEASAIHVVLKHQKICMCMHNAQGQDRVRESVCTCNKKITLFIYSFTLAFWWTSTMHPQIIQMCRCHPIFNPILICLQQTMSFSLFFYFKKFNQNRHWTHLDSMKKCQSITTCSW